MARRLSGAARSAKAAPQHCKAELSICMKARGRHRTTGSCIRDFNECKQGRGVRTYHITSENSARGGELLKWRKRRRRR